MFNNSAKIMFFLILMMSTMITISANSWLSAWMGLEINLLSFIPLMMDNNNNLMSTEASLKYFLIQTIASAILLFAIIMMFINDLMMQNNIIFNKLIMISSLLMKSGAAPFHFWFPMVMEGLSWNNNLILMTWQKIAPMMLISYLIEMNFMKYIIVISIIIGSLGGLNQISLRKLMAYSSINHLGWMLSAMQINEIMWITYFCFYSFLSFSMIFMFKNFEIYYMNQLFNSFFNSKIMKFVLFFNLLSLGGLPPFIGFLPKWFIIQSMISNNQFLLMTIMTTMTLITLYFYLRLCFAAFMLNYYENNWIYNMNFNNFSIKCMLIFSFISTFSMILISIIYPLFY